MKERKVFFSLISRIREKSHKMIEKELENYGFKELKPSYGTIFGVMYKNKGSIPLKNLIAETKKSKTTIIEHIKKLENLGYIRREKDKQDDRLNLVILTEKSYEIYPKFMGISDKIIEKAFGNIEEENILIFEKVLEKIFKNII